ncbi:putative leader peptide [Frankia tisae]
MPTGKIPTVRRHVDLLRPASALCR